MSQDSRFSFASKMGTEKTFSTQGASQDASKIFSGVSAMTRKGNKGAQIVSQWENYYNALSDDAKSEFIANLFLGYRIIKPTGGFTGSKEFIAQQEKMFNYWEKKFTEEKMPRGWNNIKRALANAEGINFIQFCAKSRQLIPMEAFPNNALILHGLSNEQIVSYIANRNKMCIALFNDKSNFDLTKRELKTEVEEKDLAEETLPNKSDVYAYAPFAAYFMPIEMMAESLEFRMTPIPQRDEKINIWRNTSVSICKDILANAKVKPIYPGPKNANELRLLYAQVRQVIFKRKQELLGGGSQVFIPSEFSYKNVETPFTSEASATGASSTKPSGGNVAKNGVFIPAGISSIEQLREYYKVPKMSENPVTYNAQFKKLSEVQQKVLTMKQTDMVW